MLPGDIGLPPGCTHSDCDPIVRCEQCGKPLSSAELTEWEQLKPPICGWCKSPAYEQDEEENN